MSFHFVQKRQPQPHGTFISDQNIGKLSISTFISFCKGSAERYLRSSSIWEQGQWPLRILNLWVPQPVQGESTQLFWQPSISTCSRSDLFSRDLDFCWAVVPVGYLFTSCGNRKLRTGDIHFTFNFSVPLPYKSKSSIRRSLKFKNISPVCDTTAQVCFDTWIQFKANSIVQIAASTLQHQMTFWTCRTSTWQPTSPLAPNRTMRAPQVRIQSTMASKRSRYHRL